LRAGQLLRPPEHCLTELAWLLCTFALVKVFQLAFLQGAEQRSFRPGIRTVSPGETDMHDDLDFSGNFNRVALAAAHNARG
jgi:hypothetical protein